MSQNTTIDAYDRVIDATRIFQKRNLEIASELLKCSNVAVAAMNEDTTSVELRAFISSVVAKMNQIDEKAETLKRDLENTRDSLMEI